MNDLDEIITIMEEKSNVLLTVLGMGKYLLRPSPKAYSQGNSRKT